MKRARKIARVVREHDFRGGVRGKYAALYREGTNIIRLSPDVSEAFPDEASVNGALRSLIKIAQHLPA
jgi:hypothetical protein